MKIAIEGCAHGELEKIYDTIQILEKKENIKVDLLICCGDFQSTRNLDDLQTMSVPQKYQNMGTFYKYYSGEKIAPIFTVFVGGNHEASNYLQELPYGGWVAPNIYYLGLAGVVKINGIRIASISGIYKCHDYLRGHHEFSPYCEATKRSVYHVRQLEVFRLKQLSNHIDIVISHDWPRGVYNYGNHNQLLDFKPHFREDISKDQLGSPPNAELLKDLKPDYWFAAHLHCKFAALVPHADSKKFTKFLALDKCIPKRRFLQILDIETENIVDFENLIFEYDLEWLTILFLTNHLLNTKSVSSYMPGPNGKDRYTFTPTNEEKEIILNKFNNDLTISKKFCQTVETYDPNNMKTFPQQPKPQINPQTKQFCETLCIDDPVTLALMLNGQEINECSVLDNSDIDNLSSFLTEREELNLTSENRHLSLPEPQNINETEILIDNADEKCKINNVETEYLKESDSVEKPLLDISENEILVDEIQSVNKIFKRRNHTIYTNEDDTINEL